MIVAEGEKQGLSYDYQTELKDKYDVDTTICILGHIQRGGNPSPVDRFIGAKMGNMAVEALIAGEDYVATVKDKGEFKLCSLDVA